MGKDSVIGWTHHTFNPWWGCVEVSPGCDHCYARELAKRFGFAVWGKDAPRRLYGERHWNAPRQWDREAARAGVRKRVFCASMGDLGEERSDEWGRKLDAERERLWSVIASTPNLDWQLLTKRPRLDKAIIPRSILSLPNVWPGVSCENANYGWRLDQLVEVECVGPKWVSYEPALGPLPWDKWLAPVPRLGWVVIGGESGKDGERRGFNLTWLRETVAACRKACVPGYVKQDSHRWPGQQGRIPGDLWIHEFPEAAARDATDTT